MELLPYSTSYPTTSMLRTQWCALGFAEPRCWTSCHGGYGLELYRGQHAEAAVASLPVVEDLQVLNDRVGELDAGGPASLVEDFGLHPAPERFDHRVDAPMSS